MSKCIFTTGSITQAMKAKRILADYSIQSEITKISTQASKKGCVHGIEFSCANKGNVGNILSSSGIKFEEYTQ